MKKSRFTESKIISILKQHESGLKVGAKYGGMSSSQLKRLKELEKENSQLKRMYADMSLVHTALKDAVEKKL